MPTTPSTPQHIDSYSIISISGHRLTSSSGKWGTIFMAATTNLAAKLIAKTCLRT
jgi:hypothetical protein